MKIQVRDVVANSVRELELQVQLIEDHSATQAVHDAVVGHLAARRMGTASTKTMGEVAGTGKKPWRQKGTGRARAGSFQSPLWRGGGVTFGPKPRDFSVKVGRQTKTLALRKAFSERVKSGDVIAIEKVDVSSAKTRDFSAFIQKLDLVGTTLIVDGEPAKNVLLAARNLPLVEVQRASEVDAYQMLRFDKVIITSSGLEVLINRIQTK